jgi:hypothetical protein
MSFQIVKVGKSLDVAQEIKELDMQDSLGAEIRDLLVRQLPKYENVKAVIVKAQGHTDPHHVGLNLTIETVY